MPARDASASMRTASPRPLPHCYHTTPAWSPARNSPSVATNVLRCSDGSPRERMALRVAWSAWVSTRVTKGVSLLSSRSMLLRR